MLVLGLGNPGDRFAGTRHNVGFEVLSAYCREHSIPLCKKVFRPLRWSGCGPIVLATPLTFMNRSGDVVPWLLSRCGLSGQDLLVITDNLDLPVGRVRLKRGGRSLSHNGIASVVKSIGTTDFLRLYVGIGRPPQGIDVVDHVLGKPEGEEAQALADAYDKATNAIHQLRERPAEQVMNEINGR